MQSDYSRAICLCRSNLSSLSSATFWSNGGSTDVNSMSSKLLHGLSQLDADTLTSLSSGMLHKVHMHNDMHACTTMQNGTPMHVNRNAVVRTMQ